MRNLILPSFPGMYNKHGEFETEILPQRSNDISNWEERIINIYSLGMGNRDIRFHFEEIYGVGISESKIT